MEVTRESIAAEFAAGLAEAERQIEFIENAGPADVAEVLALMEISVDEDADPRLAAGVRTLRRVLAV